MKEKILEIFLLVILGTFLLCDNVFAINEDYFDSLTYDEYTRWSEKDKYNYNGKNVNFSKVLSIHSFEGPFYSFHYYNLPGYRNLSAEFYKINLTKEFDSVFDTDLLVEYDKLYYLELIYYTKDKELTNIDKSENVVNAPNNFSFITNDFQTYYDHYEVFKTDWNTLNNEFFSTTHLDTYVTYGRTQCKIASDYPRVYKCRVTYQINPNVFHKSSDDPNKEVKGAQLVFRFDSLYPNNEQDDFVAISELDWHSEVAGTDDMIPEIENFPFQEFDPDGDKTVLDYIKDMFVSLLELPTKIGEYLIDGLKNLFIPSDEYLSTWFNDLKNSFDKQLGFLSYPFTLILNILDRFVSLEDTGVYMIEWPNITVPNFEEHTIIKGGCFDLAQLLNNPTINTMHSLYLLIVNALIILSFLNLCLNICNRIFGGRVDDYELLSVDEGYNLNPSTGEVIGQWTRTRRTVRKRV